MLVKLGKVQIGVVQLWNGHVTVQISSSIIALLTTALIT